MLWNAAITFEKMNMGILKLLGEPPLASLLIAANSAVIKETRNLLAGQAMVSGLWWACRRLPYQKYGLDSIVREV